jgi:hypothetical protein
MPKGHSTLEPRIAGLERANKTLCEQIIALQEQVQALRQIASPSAVVRPGPGYEPLFAKWPSASPPKDL